jgi:hypothetical protein
MFLPIFILRLDMSRLRRWRYQESIAYHRQGIRYRESFLDEIKSRKRIFFNDANQSKRSSGVYAFLDKLAAATNGRGRRRTRLRDREV